MKALCDLCGKEFDEGDLWTCKDCGAVFCGDCGDPAKELCRYCLRSVKEEGKAKP
jgi:ribosomal protein L37AE/L43A